VNKYHGNLTGNGKQSGGEGGSNAACGRRPTLTMPEKTANWPGLPGKAGPNRSGGAPTRGKLGPFTVKREG
jgi:hypothetical protein